MEKVIDENKQGSSLVLDQKNTNTKKMFIESYGCQMNFSDSEIVASILADQGYNMTHSQTSVTEFWGQEFLLHGQHIEHVHANKSQITGS